MLVRYLKYLCHALCHGLLLLYSFAAHGELILSAPPRESTQNGQVLYGPLAEHLSHLLGERVIYRHPSSWRNYQSEMTQGRYDIVFDGPHFAAWRIDTQAAQPLVKLPGELRFVLVTPKNKKQLNTLDDLVGVRICTLPTPNLGALILYSLFPNPARQPAFVPAIGSFADVAERLLAGKCEAAILREPFFKHRLAPELRSQLRVMQTSKALTNQGITVSARVGPQARRRILESLTRGEGIKVCRPILDRFSKNDPRFIPATLADYSGHNLLRDNVIYGW